jgi:hypothetical protein
MGRNSTTIASPIANVPALLRRYKTHNQFVKKSLTLSDAAKPENFKTTTKWADWAPTFLNYLRTMPEKDGVPLKCICRLNEAPDPTPNEDFLDNYVSMAALNGEAFTIDAANVHTFIVNFISGKQRNRRGQNSGLRSSKQWKTRLHFIERALRRSRIACIGHHEGGEYLEHSVLLRGEETTHVVGRI